MILAAKNEHRDTCELLLDHQADLNLQTKVNSELRFIYLKRWFRPSRLAWVPFIGLRLVAAYPSAIFLNEMAQMSIYWTK